MKKGGHKTHIPNDKSSRNKWADKWIDTNIKQLRDKYLTVKK